MSRWLDLIDGPGAVMKSPEPEPHKLQKGGLRSLCSSEEAQTQTKTALADAAEAPVGEPAPTPPPAAPVPPAAPGAAPSRAAVAHPPGELAALRHASPRAAAALEAAAPKAAPALEPVPAAGPKITVDALTRWLPVANGAELDKMAARERLGCTILGLDLLEAGVLADALHLRDRAHDDRRLCAECLNLRVQHGGWRCASTQGLRGPLTRDLAYRQPQRCPAFEQNPAWPPAPERPQPEPY